MRPDARDLAGGPALLERHARAWRVTVDRTVEAAGSLLAFGHRGSHSVVLKVLLDPADEGPFRALEHFDGHGAVRLLARAPGAGLLERLRPGTSLATLSRRGRDRDAMDVLVEVVRAMDVAAAGPDDPPGVTDAEPEGFPEVAGWGESLRAYLAGESGRVPRDLVEEAAERYDALCATQTRVRLLHGDLHHENVLFDSGRGWVAIDPKGVIGEMEYELGASLRNPAGALDELGSPHVVERRIAQFQAGLRADPDRVLEWAFAQAVLAAVWEAEDQPEGEWRSEFLPLAVTLRRLLGT